MRDSDIIDRIRLDCACAMVEMRKTILLARLAGEDELAERLTRVRDEWARAVSSAYDDAGERGAA